MPPDPTAPRTLEDLGSALGISALVAQASTETLTNVGLVLSAIIALPAALRALRECITAAADWIDRLAALVAAARGRPVPPRTSTRPTSTSSAAEPTAGPR